MKSEAPLPVLRYLRSISHQTSTLAYLKLDSKNHVLESGGNLEYFDTTELDKSVPIDEQLPALSGLIPVSDGPVIIANTHIDNLHFFDVHIYLDMGNQWVLLIDTTAIATKLQTEQQIRLSKDILAENK